MAAVSEEQELWASYRPGNDPAAQQKLFFRYAPWARAVAREVYRRVRVPQLEWGDYVHNATVGLLEAMSRFDSARGVDFMGYAKARVRGAVFNGLRVYLSESSRRDGGSRALDRLESFDGGHEEDSLSQVIATVAGLGLGFLLDASASADAFRVDRDPSLIAEKHQMDRLTEEALSSLPERERVVITLHYFQYVPFVDIAAMLKVTKGRVSQIHKSAVERMRTSIHGPPISGRSV